MKREQARLKALRAMPYEKYLQTPEWKDVEQAALKRAGKRCQVCRVEGVALRVSHTTLDTLGCEQESDVLVLCEGCYDHLAQKVQRFAAQTADQADASHEEPDVPHFSLIKKALIFTPSAIVLDGLFALLHAPLPAELFGVGAAIALAANSPKIYAGIRDSLPESWQEYLDERAMRKQERAATGEWSNWDRLLGRHLDDAQPRQAETSDVAGKEGGKDAQDYLNLGPTLQPHADRLLSGRKVILGVSGSGKTNTMNVYIEEIGGLDPAPAIILFDTDDENRAICSKKYWPNPAWMDKEWGLSRHNASEVAQTILEERYQCVVNLQSYEEEEAAWIMIHMIKGVQAWQEAREIRVPCEIVLDEASVWLPQNPRESVLSSVMVDDPDPQDDEDQKKIPLLALLQRAYFRTIVRRGRRRGMGFTLAAQRIAEIDKRALQGSWMFLMRQTQPADWREYKEFGISSEEARSLLDGEAYVFAPGCDREKHRLRESRSPHGGVTPGMKALRSHQTQQHATPAPKASDPMAPVTRPPTTWAEAGPAASKQESALDTVLQLRGQVDEHTFLTMIGALTARTSASTGEQPSREPSSRSGVNEQRTSIVTTRQRRSTAAMPAEIRAALAVLEPRMTYRDLAVKLGYSDGEARTIWQEMRKRGLLRSPVPADQAETTERRPTLYPLPRYSDPAQPEQDGKSKRRMFTPSEVARGYALWLAGNTSVRTLEEAADNAGYGWSNGFVRDLIDEMDEQKLIQKRKKGAV